MTWQEAALVMAGIIGSSVAVVHGVLVQRLMVRPLQALLPTGSRKAASTKRLVPPLLQFSTFNWFIGGLALIAAVIWFDRDARFAVCLLVGSSYGFGALANFWGTRGRHPGWMLYAVALLLIVFGVSEFAG